MMRRSCAWLLVAGSIFLYSGCARHTAFQGGELTKTSLGWFLGPEYFANFQEVDLNKNGRYLMVFRRFPDSRAWLDLGLIGLTSRDEESLAPFTSEITMELKTEDGSQVCKATGKLNEIKGAGFHHWRLDGSRNSASLRHPDCLWLKVRRYQSHTLKITVAGATEGFGSLWAVPRLYTPPCC
jgi:hypothetical protein